MPDPAADLIWPTDEEPAEVVSANDRSASSERLSTLRAVYSQGCASNAFRALAEAGVSWSAIRYLHSVTGSIP